MPHKHLVNPHKKDEEERDADGHWDREVRVLGLLSTGGDGVESHVAVEASGSSGKSAAEPEGEETTGAVAETSMKGFQRFPASKPFCLTERIRTTILDIPLRRLPLKNCTLQATVI